MPSHSGMDGCILSHLVENKSASLHELPVQDGEVLGRERFDSDEPCVVPLSGVRDGFDTQVRAADAAAVGIQRPLHGGWPILLDARDGGLQQPDATRTG